MMETIFKYSPTVEDLDEIGPSYSSLTENEYRTSLEKRAEARGSNINYESIADLQHLFKFRGDRENFNKYTEILNKDFADLRVTLFNE